MAYIPDHFGIYLTLPFNFYLSLSPSFFLDFIPNKFIIQVFSLSSLLGTTLSDWKICATWISYLGTLGSIRLPSEYRLGISFLSVYVLVSPIGTSTRIGSLPLMSFLSQFKS